MSVQTQIDRLTGAKTNLSTWLTNNGVTVPDGTLLDGLVSLLDSVESFKVYEGTVTAPGSAGKSFTFTIEHGLGHVPVFFALVPSMTSYGDGYYLANVWASGCNGFDSGVVSSDADGDAILQSFIVDLTGAMPVNVTTFNSTTVTFNKRAGYGSRIRGTFKVVMF